MANGRQLEVDKEYIRSHSGILRLCHVFLSLSFLICAESSGFCFLLYAKRFHFVEFVTITSMLLAFLFWLLYLFNVQDRIWINLPLTMLLNDSILSLFHFIAAVLCFSAFCSHPYGQGANAAAKVGGVFGLLAMIAFIFHAWIDYRTLRDLRMSITGTVETVHTTTA